MNKTDENDVKTDKKHVCQTCGASFNRPYRLTQHLLLHQNIKIFQCGEEGCDKSYTSKSHLDRHLYSAHIKPDFGEVHRCPECMKTFSNRQNLKRHIKIKHATKSAFKCDVCRRDFKKKHLLLTHMYYHTLVKPFSCDLCDKEFISLLEKKKHMKYHKTYNCERCDMSFNHWTKYLKHKRNDHDVKEYICNDCGRKFKERAHIVHHVKIHMTEAKQKQTFKCWYEDCNRVYSRHSNLKQHIAMRHLMLTYPCNICDQKLSSKAALKRHIINHSKPVDLSVKPKTKETGRKERKDKGILRKTTALKIAGLFDPKNMKYGNDNDKDIHIVQDTSPKNAQKESLESSSNCDQNTTVKEDNVSGSVIISLEVNKTETTGDDKQAVTSLHSHNPVPVS